MGWEFSIPGGQNNRNVVALRPGGHGELNTGHFRHGLIGDDYIDSGLTPEYFESLFT